MARFAAWFSLLIIASLAFTQTDSTPVTARGSSTRDVGPITVSTLSACSNPNAPPTPEIGRFESLLGPPAHSDLTQSGLTKQSADVGCCCLLKDSGPPPAWDCTGSTEGTESTEAQCKKDADDVGAKYKWHSGKCTGKE